MLRFWKQQVSQSNLPLGHLETTVMEILWQRGASNVRDVGQCLARPLAYTTVMTTLDRLYKKGLLDRQKQDRAFIYVPRYTRRQWEQKRAGDFMAAAPRDLLVSCLVDAAGEHDAALLDELERQIRLKRQELRRLRP
jgi:predicted transcriptional regulator